MVQEGRGHAAIDVWAIGEAALWSVSLVCGAGGDRAPSRSEATPCREVARRLGRVASTISRELRRNAATRKRRPRVSCDGQRNGTPSRRCSPAQSRRSLRRNAALRTYVEERLAGVVVAPSGAPPFPARSCPGKSRRHGPRKDRRWANAWSPEQTARRSPVDFADDATMRISHEAIYQALFVQGRGALLPRTDGTAYAPGACCGCRGRARAGEAAFISPEIMISQRPAEEQPIAPCRATGKETLSWVLGVRRSAP